MLEFSTSAVPCCRLCCPSLHLVSEPQLPGPSWSPHTPASARKYLGCKRLRFLLSPAGEVNRTLSWGWGAISK